MFREQSSSIDCDLGGVFVSSPVTSYASLLLKPSGNASGLGTLYGSNDNINFDIVSSDTTLFDVSKTIEILNPFYLYYSVVISAGGSGSLTYDFIQDYKPFNEERADYIQVITESTFSSLALGETSSTAYRGDRGKIAYDHSQINTGNPHNTTAAHVGAYTTTQTDTLLESKADLIDGKLASSQVPAIAISEYLGAVANQTAMLALIGQVGDWCIRSDEQKAFVITGSDASVFSSWTAIVTPASPVSSVNGQVGVVVLSASDVGAPSGSGTSTGSNTGDETTSSIKSKLSISVLSGDNTGDETTSTIQTKRPLKTINNKSIEGSGNVYLSRMNQSINSQAITAATDTYLTGSAIDCPTPIVGTKITFTVIATKTNAGTVAPIFRIRFGTNGSLSDAVVLTFTGNAQTAVVDTCKIVIEILFTTVGASGIVRGFYHLAHNLSTTGFANVPNNVIQLTSGAFDTTVANLKAGVSVNSGTSAVWTIQNVSTKIENI
jgi:hypothetical protein